MKFHPLRTATGLLYGAVLLASAPGQTAARQTPLSEAAIAQIESLQRDKASRTPAQRKLDSALIYEARQRAGRAPAPGVPALQNDVEVARDGTVVVEIVGTNPGDVARAVLLSGGTNLFVPRAAGAVTARVPLSRVETLAAYPAVSFVGRQDRAFTRATSEGKAAHGVTTVATRYGLTGQGVKIGVLSDSVKGLAASQGAGELPAVTVLSGQGGPGGDPNAGTGEGTAMLEIVHDLAPNASLYFATAVTSQAAFAQNIRDLAAAGCKVIVDDIGFDAEPAFQDGVIAAAVNDVAASGVLYFSAAGNDGRKNANTSSVWEGDFAAGPEISFLGEPLRGSQLQSFGANSYNTVTTAGGNATLQWSDKFGSAANDYDLYRLNSAGTTVLASSTTTQSGTQNPYESVGATATGNRLVVIKSAAAAARYLRLQNIGGGLGVSTAGVTWGHPATAGAFGVAATSAQGRTIEFTSANGVETFSSDGPRKVFYNAAGNPITPGNFLAAGGASLQKPDLTAADGVVTTVAGFNPFFGTSAAAPHAAAIAALFLEFDSSLDPAGFTSLLPNAVVDLAPVGWDRDSGRGILMARTGAEKLVGDAYVGLALSAPSVLQTQDVTGTITLSRPAPPAGLTFNLAALPAGALDVPVTVTVPAGQTMGTFTATGGSGPLGNVTLTAALADGEGSRNTSIVLEALYQIQSVSLDQSVVLGGGSTTGTVTISNPAPAGGYIVRLNTGDDSVSNISPRSLTIPEGANSGVFTVTTSPTSVDRVVTVSARRTDYTGVVSTPLAIRFARVTALMLSPSTVSGGSSSTGTVTISGPAPAGGMVVRLRTNAPSIVPIPATVTVPAGQTSVSFAIPTTNPSKNSRVRCFAQTNSSTSAWADLRVNRL